MSFESNMIKVANELLYFNLYSTDETIGKIYMMRSLESNFDLTFTDMTNDANELLTDSRITVNATFSNPAPKSFASVDLSSNVVDIDTPII